VFGTDVDACRFQTDVYAVGTVVTLGGSVGIGVDIKCVIRACLHTGFAADTAVFIKINNAIRAEIKGFDRADFDAGCICAVVTTHYGKYTPCIGKFTFFHLFHPGAKNADGYVVFRLAGGGTGVAADAFSVVNDEAVLHIQVGLSLAISIRVERKAK
jgi:hypothetical protein